MVVLTCLGVSLVGGVILGVGWRVVESFFERRANKPE